MENTIIKRVVIWQKHNYKPQPSPLEIDRSTFSGAKDQPQLIRQKIWLT